MPQPTSRKKPSNQSDYLKYSALAFQIVAAMAFFILLGYYLDKWVATGFPVFLLACSILGIVMVMVILFRTVGKTK